MSEIKTVTLPKGEYDSMEKELKKLTAFKESKTDVIYKVDRFNYLDSSGYMSYSSNYRANVDFEVVHKDVIEKEVFNRNKELAEELAKLKNEKVALEDSFKNEISELKTELRKAKGGKSGAEYRLDRARIKINSLKERGFWDRVFNIEV